MTESRFHFLEADFPCLYETCVQAEQAAESDVAMMKIRQAMELMLRDLGARNRDFFLSINELEGRAILDQETSRQFHDLRRIVNQKSDGKEATDIQSCLDQLSDLILDCGLKPEKTYGVNPFFLDEGRCLARAVKLAEDTAESESDDNWSIDPLKLADIIQNPEGLQQAQMSLSRRESETQEDFERRIAGRPPVCIGCAILDTRQKDGYTDVNFLVHHIDYNPGIRFSPVSAFYTTGVTVDKVIDGELFAKLKVHEGKVCCDYSQVSLQDGDDVISVQPICWDKLFYENDEEYNARISNLPLLPVGLGTVDRRESDLEPWKLSMDINPFRYAEPVLGNLLSPDKKMKVECHSDLVKKLCDGKLPCLLFVKLHKTWAAARSVLWREDVGEIVENNYVDAVDWLQKGYHRGYAPAQYQLGMLTLEMSKDYPNASIDISSAAYKGYAPAEYQLGNLYYNGQGVDQDYWKAIEWCRKAAKHGYAPAQHQLGYFYYNGQGVEKDYRAAADWFRKAAEQGYAEAQNDLGWLYYIGAGVEHDYQTAAAWFRQGAEQGSILAQNNLGDCYYNGQGVEQDYQQAAIWYRKAAEQGYAWAQFNLATCYLDGQGVNSDWQKAAEWYEEAKVQGKDDEALQKLIQEVYEDYEFLKQDAENDLS